MALDNQKLMREIVSNKSKWLLWHQNNQKLEETTEKYCSGRIVKLSVEREGELGDLDSDDINIIFKFKKKKVFFSFFLYLIIFCFGTSICFFFSNRRSIRCGGIEIDAWRWLRKKTFLPLLAFIWIKKPVANKNLGVRKGKKLAGCGSSINAPVGSAFKAQIVRHWLWTCHHAFLFRRQ